LCHGLLLQCLQSLRLALGECRKRLYRDRQQRYHVMFSGISFDA
jgi:hypothetical protein